MDLPRRFCAIQRFAASEVAQAKERSYYDQHPTNHFLLLAIEVLGCLGKQVNVFLHDCANAMWNFKRLEGPLLCFDYFSLSKNLKYITKDVSVLHLKLGSNSRSS
jgi:hypothetical protein